MKIDPHQCKGTGACQPYCPVGAIATVEWEGRPVSEINQDECVECGVCQRSGVCPNDAIHQTELEWPRSIRSAFSNPTTSHRETNVGGRGTEEMKTNDVTGRFREGVAGVLVEMGRPGVGTRLRDLQKVTMAIAKLGVEFESRNPVTSLMSDQKTGQIREEILNEKVLSAIVGFMIENGRLKGSLEVLREVAHEIDTVFSLGLISKVGRDGEMGTVPIAKEAGFFPYPNTKTNVGLGRPLKRG